MGGSTTNQAIMNPQKNILPKFLPSPTIRAALWCHLVEAPPPGFPVLHGAPSDSVTGQESNEDNQPSEVSCLVEMCSCCNFYMSSSFFVKQMPVMREMIDGGQWSVLCIFLRPWKEHQDPHNYWIFAFVETVTARIEWADIWVPQKTLPTSNSSIGYMARAHEIFPFCWLWTASMPSWNSLQNLSRLTTEPLKS